jgi:glycosyltransferase involved in cell wall biosynthesis
VKIGYVIKAFPRLSETFILNELLELERQGCEITVFSRYPGQQVPHAAMNGLRARIVPLEPLLKERFWEGFMLQRDWSRERPFVLDMALSFRNKEEMRYWLQAASVARAVKDEGIELLHAHFATGSASVARYAAQLVGIPYTLTAHAKDIYAVDVDRDRLRAILGDSATTVTVSDANVSYLGELAPQARVRRVYNGLDLTRFPVRAEKPESSTAPLLLFVGRLVEKKGVGDLLTAIALLRRQGRELRLRIVGTGELETTLRDQVTQLGLRDCVDFAGPASQEELVTQHLASADLFVLPAIVAADGDRDGLPTTLLEAMACGVPVITTDIPGIDEATPHGDAGVLVSPGQPQALAAAIDQALRERGVTAQRAIRARQRVESLFDVRKTVPQLLDVMHGAVTSWRSEASA